jgi:hypothetical protein
MKNRVSICVALCAAAMAALALGESSGIAQTKQKEHVQFPTVAARPEDVSSIEAIVHASYETISGGVGVARQWGRDQTLYDPHARFVGIAIDPLSKETRTDSFSEQEFADETNAESVKDGFVERELGHSIQRFGNVATVLSSYEIKVSATGKVAAHGVNMLQLYFDGKRWWILSVVWDEERPGNPIPAELLPKN